MESKKILILLVISCVLLSVSIDSTEAQGLRWGRREFNNDDEYARAFQEWLHQRDATKKRGGFNDNDSDGSGEVCRGCAPPPDRISRLCILEYFSISAYWAAQPFLKTILDILLNDSGDQCDGGSKLLTFVVML